MSELNDFAARSERSLSREQAEAMRKAIAEAAQALSDSIDEQIINNMFTQCGGSAIMTNGRCDKCGAVVESSGGVCGRLVQLA